MYSKGDIVLIQFPFSDLINAKKRPMVVLAVKGEDVIGCAITSNPDTDGVSLPSGTLPLESKIKYWQIHTFIGSLVMKKVATVPKKTHRDLLDKINNFFSI
ncbi:MAG: type II toxin-antitoxin system PemK/MazF family toxin [Nanoarchaeota archaeon]